MFGNILFTKAFKGYINPTYSKPVITNGERLCKYLQAQQLCQLTLNCIMGHYETKYSYIVKLDCISAIMCHNTTLQYVS